jgi:hypothetical protein
MLVSKSALSKVIKTIDDFDLSGSPFAGLQWGENGPKFHRSGPAGYVETIGYRPGPPNLVISITHLKEILTRFDDDQIDMSENKGGHLVLTSVGNTFETSLHVHTIHPNVTWAKTHEPGPRTSRLDPAAFAGINTSPFKLAAAPVLRQGKLMLVTDYGIIMRSQVQADAYPYPRESFLRTVSSLAMQELYLTANGYWSATAGGFHVMISGHRTGDAIFDMYNRGAETLTEIPAARLTSAIGHAAAIATSANKSRVTFDPERGLVVVDGYGNEGKFALGTSTGWSRFAVPAATAKVLADVLRQGTDEMAQIQQVESQTLRITRGLWEVSFKKFPDNSTNDTSGL